MISKEVSSPEVLLKLELASIFSYSELVL